MSSPLWQVRTCFLVKLVDVGRLICLSDLTFFVTMYIGHANMHLLVLSWENLKCMQRLGRIFFQLLNLNIFLQDQSIFVMFFFFFSSFRIMIISFKKYWKDNIWDNQIQCFFYYKLKSKQTVLQKIKWNRDHEDNCNIFNSIFV